MRFSDILSIAFRSVRSNMLRTVLTVLIIALGITALVVVNTAIKAINQKFTESFSTMGASGFTIRYKQRNIRFGGGGGSEIKKEKKGSKKEGMRSLLTRLKRQALTLYYLAEMRII
jgi:putative ABC transport system permease protein